MNKNINKELHTYFNCSIGICGSSGKERGEGFSAQSAASILEEGTGQWLRDAKNKKRQVPRGVHAVSPSFGAQFACMMYPGQKRRACNLVAIALAQPKAILDLVEKHA